MRRSVLKSFIYVFLLGTFYCTAFGQGTVSVTSPKEWHTQPVDNAAMNERVEDAAEQYKQYAPIPRIAFYDIGYPKDATELAELNGYAVLLISALSQESSELPLKRVYISNNGKEIELKKIKEFKIKNSDRKNRIVLTFGEYRIDTLYLLPVHLTFRSGLLLTDFAKNRVGLRLAEFGDSKPPDVAALPNLIPDEKKSIDEALAKFLKREYPGYMDK